MTIPYEIEEFQKRHKKPLEVGMAVYLRNNKDIEYEVDFIKRNKSKDKVWVSLGEEGGFIYSPLDLEPV